MNNKFLIASLIIGILFFLFIVYTIRKRNLSPSYSILWIILSVFFISIPVFEGAYIAVSRLFGLYAENVIYISVIGFLLVYVLYLTMKIVRLNNQVKELISFTAILENKISRGNS